MDVKVITTSCPWPLTVHCKSCQLEALILSDLSGASLTLEAVKNKDLITQIIQNCLYKDYFKSSKGSDYTIIKFVRRLQIVKFIQKPLTAQRKKPYSYVIGGGKKSWNQFSLSLGASVAWRIDHICTRLKCAVHSALRK